MASLPQTAAVGVSMVHAFEHAFAHAAIGMALVDIDGRFLRVNDALCRITGYPRDQLELVRFANCRMQQMLTSMRLRSSGWSVAICLPIKSNDGTCTLMVTSSGGC
jgi:PAS domain-containing protein